jgi:glycosyltransferase involved in cell wall biosynthesis
MFSWEFPPLIAGGLAMACYGMVKSLLKQGVEIDLVLPTKDLVYFPLRKVADADDLPVVFFDPVKHKEFQEITHETIITKLEYLGISVSPETYINGSELKTWTKLIEHVTVEKYKYTSIQEKIWNDLKICLFGDEDIFKKVQELTIRAEKYARQLDYDLIHCHDWLTYPAGMIAKRISGKPLVSHMHATEFDRAGGYGDGRIHNLEYDGMSYADRVICVSKYTANMVISRYHIDSGKIRIIHNAYDVENLDMHNKERLFKGPTILFLGRITLQKGPDYFLEIANEVLKKHPHARFIMAGTGDMARRLLHRSAFLRLRNKFIFAGFLNRIQVDKILKAADIYVLPSVSEPFGIAPLEAMAYGITAIISKQSGVAEVVKNAYKIDFWDVPKMAEIINYLIENPVESALMGEKGSLEVQSIGWDEASKKIFDVYNELL